MPSNPAHKSEETRTNARAKPKPVQTQAAPQRAAAPPEAVQRALADPLGAGPGEILALQQTIGNRAVNKLLASAANPADPPASGGSPPQVQFKLAVGPAGDQYEQEADRVAESILRMPAPVQRVEEEEEEPLQRQAVVQRAPEDQEEEDEPLLQRLFMAQRDPAGDDGQNGGAGGGSDKPNAPGAPLVQRGLAPPADPRAGFEVAGDVERQITGSAGGGKPLPESTRAFMEPRFGADFSSVRVHTGGAASHLNRQLSAQAFTRGADIYFDAGKYNPGTTAGNRLLAHELTHVVQQGHAPAGQAQAQRAPARRKARPAATKPGGEAVQRALTAESARAFTTAAAANPKYEHGQKLTDKFATPVEEPSGYAPWQTEVAAQLPDDNVTEGEQNKINKLGRTHGWKFWKKSNEQEQKLKDFARAFMLWDFASRTNQLRPEDTAKYGTLPADQKLKKRIGYMKHAAPFQEKFKGLVALGPTAPETQAFLQQEGFLSAMQIGEEQQKKVEAKGPRIDVRSTFIGGPILGIHLRAHLFIVYTGRDGKQYYIRGGPGEDLDPNDPTDAGYVTVDYGEYAADTVDYDPSAPSVTVLSGDAAEAKFDAMIEAAQAANAMKIPYRAQVEGKFAQRFDEESKFRTLLGVFGSKGENCNRAAWTVLARAGVPRKKPLGKHPGWGSMLGADTPDRKGMRPPEKDDPSAARTITLNSDRDVVDKEGNVQVYVDRRFFLQAAKVPAGTQVEELSDQIEFRKIRYGDGKIGYIEKKSKDIRRTGRSRMRLALMDRGWYTEDALDEITEEMSKNDFGRALLLMQDAGLDRDWDSIQATYQLLVSLYNDFRKPAAARFQEQLDKMSDAEVRRLKTDYDEFRAFIEDVDVDISDAVKMVEARLKTIETHDKIVTAIWERADQPVQLNYWINHLPDYDDVYEIGRATGESRSLVREIMDSLRPEQNQGYFLEEMLDDVDNIDAFDAIAQDDPGAAEVIDGVSGEIGTDRAFVIKRTIDYMHDNKGRMKKLRQEKEAAEGGGGDLPHYGYKSMSPPGLDAKVEGTLPRSAIPKIAVSSVQGAWTELVVNGDYYWVKSDDYQAFLNPPKAGKKAGYDPKDYPGGKHKLPLTEAKTFKVAATEDAPLDIDFTVDPKVGGVWVVVLDEMTTKSGRGRLQHNGRVYYIDLAVAFGPPKSAPQLDEDVLDEILKELSGPGKKEETLVGGILEASEDKPVVLMDQMGGGEVDTFTAPRRIEILDENFPDKSNDWDLIFVKDVDGGRFGAIYADKLKAAYKPAGSQAPPKVESVAEAPVTEKVVQSSGFSTEEWPQGNHDWPWEEEVTLKVARTRDGPADTEMTFLPSGKYKKITVLDDLTTTLGRLIVWYNGVQYFVPMMDFAKALPEPEEDLEELEENISTVIPQDVVEAPKESVDMEEVRAAFQKIKDAVDMYGANDIDQFIYGNLISSSDLVLALSGEGAEDRAQQILDMTDTPLSAQQLVNLYGPKK